LIKRSTITGILLLCLLLLGLGLAYQTDLKSELEKPVIKEGDNTTRMYSTGFLAPSRVEEVQAAKKYRKVRYIKRYRYVKRYRHGRVRYVRAAYYIKVTTSYYKSSGRGTGDCWQCSEVLYSKLKAKGFHVRILQYPTSYSPRHRSVQYMVGGKWCNFDYKGQGYANRYYWTRNYVNGHVVKSC